VGSGLPGESGFDASEDGIKGLLKVVEKLIFDGDWMNNDWSGIILVASNCGSAGNNCGAVEKRLNEIISTCGDAFGKDNEWALCGYEDADGFLDGLSVNDIAINAESAHAADTEFGQPALFEEVPTGHNEEV
jgi:hypothetical protein